MLLTLLALLAASSGLLIANAQQVNTPASLTTCQPSQLVIEGGTAPYFVQILSGGQPSGKAIETLPTVYKSGPLTWLVDVPAGTSITLSVTDSTGAINYSSPITVQQGSSSDCVGKNAQVSAAAPSPSGSSSTFASSSSSVTAASPSSTASSSDDESSSSTPTSTKQETKQLLPSTTAASSSTTVVLAATPTQPPQGSSAGAGKSEARKFALVGGAGLALLLAFA